MLNKKNEVRHSLQFLVQLQKYSAKSKNNGYALIMTSLIAILMFGMLSAYLFSGRMYKAGSNALIDAGSTFYASESGLNKRATEIRKKFDGYSEPKGTEPGGANPAAQMANCMSSTSTSKGTGDFACNVIATKYREAVQTNESSGMTVGIGNDFKTSTNINYNSFSFVKSIPNPNGSTLQVLDSGPFTGLRSIDNRFRVYSTAVKQAGSSDAGISAQSMLQMEFINHFIPVFQFAAFYEKDLEMTNSGRMNITGPVHTNANLYLAPGGLLVLNNRATYVSNAYRSLSYTATHGGTTDGQRALLIGGGPYSTGINTLTTTTGLSGQNAINVVPAWSNPNLLISNTDVTASKGMLRKIGKLQLPDVGFLSRTGEYRAKADVQIDFDPAQKVITETTGGKTLPFNVTSINRSAATPTSIDFKASPGLIDSLQKPVMLRLDSFTADWRLSAVTRLCPRLDGGMGEPITIEGATTGAIPTVATVTLALDDNSRRKVIAALQEAIAITPNITYAATKVSAGTTSTSFRDAFRNAMKTARPDSLPIIPAATADTISNQPLNQIAALNVNGDATGRTDPAKNGGGGCFLPAPMQVIRNVYDRKENFTSTTGRQMTILQSNIKSLTVWNKDGWYWDTSALSMNSTNDLLFIKKAATVVPTGLTNAKATGNCDLECLGLAPNDTTEGGLEWHYSLIDRTSDTSYSYVSGNGTARSNTAGLSPFGFAFSGGNRLPGPLTIASDQAIYLQGDYNNPSNTAGDIGTNANAAGVLDLDQSRFPENNPNTATNIPPAREKRPAAFLGDSMTILSNACYDASYTVAACLTPSTGGLQTAGTAAVRATVVRAAILSGTESTVLTPTFERGAALNNHIRMLEDWYNPVSGGLPDKTFKYRGSFVSKGLQTEFNGQYRGGSGTGFGADYYGIPNRDFGYDEDFNRVDGLPPLTPRVNYLTQQVFKRDYDSNNR
jgi:hypothetical protein